jgi:DHA1 family bicyclomycin/chloramphenicol resistance-like MFS transporter
MNPNLVNATSCEGLAFKRVRHDHATVPPAMLRPDHPAMTLLLGALVAVAPLAMDIYLPAMPAMTAALRATPEEVQLTVSVYMFGWGMAQLFAGPLADRFGRKPTLNGGLLVFVVASIACALARSIDMLIAARFVQALAMATVVVVPRAIVRDLYAGDRAAHALSTMMLVLAVVPVVAPLVGAELSVRIGWRSNFTFVAICGALAWAAVRYGLPETLALRDQHALKLGRMAGNWQEALRSRQLVGFLLVVTFATCGLFAFLAGSAFVFVDGMSTGERGYAVYFGLVMLGSFIGAWLARRIVVGIGLRRVIALGTVLLMLAGSMLAALAWSDVRHPLAVALPMLLYMVAYMFAVPQATAGALTPFPHIAGSVASLLSFVQLVGAATCAFIVGAVYDGTGRPMATAIAVASLLAFVASRTLVPPNRA